MPHTGKYSIHLDNRYGYLKLIDVPSLVQNAAESWFNQTLTQVNDCVVRLGVFKSGEFHWHKHDIEDEFFFVLSGELILETRNEAVRLGVQQGFVMPKGVVHRTRVEQPTVVLMVEGAGVIPTGDPIKS